ncbi:hypothetical protein Patl1_06594 [Pistacia atlantica]|uniref:Uncharacterized protein n=1 Tax=Pistacia atlantica TaxID=434234 RepID=A0ACC1BUW5_9ROSI|nr:hypothetical protein Patl1_06594 [Pistacia atlantica]
MRFNFDFSEANTDSRRSLTPKEELEWSPLQSHPVFSAAYGDSSTGKESSGTPKNLVAWDGASRLYYWNSNKGCLHRISIRLGEPDPTSIIAASPSKVLQPDVKLNFEVNRISINRNGSALLLAGSDGLCVMYLYGRTCTTDSNTLVCRTVSIGAQIYFSSSSNAIRILQVSWHPYSETHLGILSSDSVFSSHWKYYTIGNLYVYFISISVPHLEGIVTILSFGRLFNLSSDLMQPEQEYYLQPVEPGRSRNAASICPVDFSFGGDHLWDRFTVFVLFSDGSIYILCPIVPFGSVYKWESILEIYSDAHTFGLRSSNSSAISNSSLAISWLEATFPELAQDAVDEGDLPTLKAHPHALFNSSLSLQGPLRKVCHGGEDEVLAVWEGQNLKVVQSVFYALADEIQPVWIVGNAPRLRVDYHDHILGLAMICEPMSVQFPIVKLDQPVDHTVWLGHPPPLLRLATVDLALPRNTDSGSLITIQNRGKDETVRTPSVHPVLSTCQGETSSSSRLCGFVSLSDSFGYSWIVGVTSTHECIVLEMKSWNLLLPIQIDTEKKPINLGERKETDTPDIISKELLVGPKVVLHPQALPNLRSVAADSIEGRSTLHQYFKLFHENYVEYAHKVYFELKHHAPQLMRLIDDQHARLREAQEKISQVEVKQPRLEERIDHAIEIHNSLEQRLQRLRNLPGAHKKPLSRAEREFKSELDQFTGVELDALHSSIEALRARLRRLHNLQQRAVQTNKGKH